jgi:hypothetical protein
MLYTIKLKTMILKKLFYMGVLQVKGSIQAEGAGEQVAEKFIWT